ncbi:LysR family transcriptional regulator [Zoogloea sp.]|uniref:LysR family transcriptional regulator n=1 Tax=Zoogloea sp. TaxID=49181 RepID=UPI0035B226A1
MSDDSDLHFFALVVRAGSLAAAAAELGVTPPAVSRRLAGLEKRLGVGLLQRSTRRQSLTPAGQRYLEGGQSILAEIRRLEMGLLEDAQALRGVLRINATLGFGRRHLGAALAAFAQQHPGVDVLLQLSDRPLDLIAEGLDLGIWFGTPPDARVIARRILANQRVLCAAPAYLARRGTPSGPEQLASHDCIVIRENTRAYNHWPLFCADAQLTCKVQGRMQTNHGEVAVDWALAGLGIILRSAWDVGQHLHSGRLVRILPAWVGAPADIYGVYPRQHQASPLVGLLLDFLVTHFAAAAGEEA